MSVETNMKGDLLIFAGNRATEGVVVMTSFDGYFDVVDKIVFQEPVISIKRLLNSDYLIAAFPTNFTIFELRETTVFPICKFTDQSIADINHLAFSDNNLVLLHHSGTRLSHIQFNTLNLDDL